MTKEKSWNFLFIFTGLMPISSGLQYFIAGQAYQNTSLRNYAVVGQILFGLAVVCFGVWQNKKLSKQNG
jgi:hypothetical protein